MNWDDEYLTPGKCFLCGKYSTPRIPPLRLLDLGSYFIIGEICIGCESMFAGFPEAFVWELTLIREM